MRRCLPPTPISSRHWRRARSRSRAGMRLLRYRRSSKRARAEAMCATATAIFTCATSWRSRASLFCSTPSSSTILSPRSTCSTISPSCSWISASAGLTAHANEVLNAYLDVEGSTGNLLGLAALPLFLSMRAMIRAKVELLRAGKADKGEDRDEAREEARAYFALARSFVAPADRAQLIAIGGLSGSGKSAVGRRIARRIGAFPGAVHVRSDVERKRLFGVAPNTRLPDRAYTAEISDEIYAICRKRARLALRAGRTVIVDAVHARPEERAAIDGSCGARKRLLYRALARSAARGHAGEGGQARRRCLRRDAFRGR